MPTAAHTAPTVEPGGDVQTVAFVSLGCPKNLVDSEKMLGLLAEDGIIPVPEHAAAAGEADAVVINTCGFLEASKEESLGEIHRAVELKERGLVKRVVVAGCLVQRHRARMLEWCPGIDAMIGVFDRDRITHAVRGGAASAVSSASDAAVELPIYSSIAANATLAKKHRDITAPGYFEDDSARLRLTPRHYAYLRISEGCNQNCAFCTIPSIRGKMRSKPPGRILDEARELLADGAFELNLIGQDTTSYGHDIGYEPGLVGLLEALDALARENGGAWVRLMYAYPSCFTDEMIDAIARLPNIVKYIDMPLQHINDGVLDAMRRKTSRKLIETLLDKLRTRIPGIAIRTTFITGFPGETGDQHDELVAFVKDAPGGGFDAMGVFPYSPEPGTPAGTLHSRGHAVPDHTVGARLDELMLAQQQVAFTRAADLARRGVELDALIDAQAGPGQPSDEGPDLPDLQNPANLKIYQARTPAQAPQVDALTHVYCTDPAGLSPGEVVRCRITDSRGYDLIARPLAELNPATALPILR